MGNKVFYLSLSRGLSGYYIKVEATSEEVVREYGSNYYANNWCSVYQEEDIQRFRTRGWQTIIVNEFNPVVLNDSGFYN